MAKQKLEPIEEAFKELTGKNPEYSEDKYSRYMKAQPTCQASPWRSRLSTSLTTNCASSDSLNVSTTLSGMPSSLSVQRAFSLRLLFTDTTWCAASKMVLVDR